MPSSFSLPDFNPNAAEPDWIAARFEEVAAHTGAVVLETNVELDQPINIEKAKRRLQDLVKAGHVAVQDLGGDIRMYETFCEMRDFAISQAEAVDLVSQYYVPHCTPNTASIEWLDIKATNAYRYGQSSVGCEAAHDPAEVFASFVASPPPPPNVETLVSVDLYDLIRTDVIPTETLIGDDIAEKGIPIFLKGHGGSHKSRLGLQTMLEVGLGAKCTAWGGRQCKQATGVFVSSEDSANQINGRLHGMARRLGYKIEHKGVAHVLDRKGQDSRLVVMNEGGIPDKLPFYDALVAYLKAIPGHKFVVLDSIVDYVSWNGKAKIDEAAVNAFVKVVLQGICDKCDCTLLCIWHTSAAGKDTGDGWSVAWHNAPREAWFSKGQEDKTIELHKVKHNHTAPVDPVHLYYSDGALVPFVASSAEGRKMTEAVVKVALRAAETGQPLQSKGTPPKWALNHIEKDAGRRPTNRELRETLDNAVHLKYLVYQGYGVQGRGFPAGYYPHPAGEVPTIAPSEDNDAEVSPE